MNALLSVLLAPICAACGDVLDIPTDGCVCRNCWDAIQPPAAVAGPTGSIDMFAAIGEYDGALREIVHALKYQGRRSLAKRLGALMRTQVPSLLEEANCVVPVPLHWRREWTRGFNQSRELAAQLGPPVLNVLSRIRATPPQVDLAAHQRHHNVRGAFAIRRPWLRSRIDIEKQSLVLVDDVSTTGATLEECALILKRAGAQRVYGLAAARVSGSQYFQSPIPNP